MKMKGFYQQGDVIIEPISSLPNGKQVEKQSRGFILVEGEATGHAHVVDDDIELILDKAGRMFMSNDHPVTLKHDTHKSFVIPAGVWEVRIVREYDHFKEEARNIKD